MNQETKNPFIFFLLLDEILPRTFFVFNKYLQELGFILVPVKKDQLETLKAFSDQEHLIVMTSVMDSSEFKIYNSEIRHLLKYFLKSRRVSFFLFSSFSLLDDAKNFSIIKNFFFLNYPLNAREISWRLVRYHSIKMGELIRWPGGKATGGAPRLDQN